MTRRSTGTHRQRTSSTACRQQYTSMAARHQNGCWAITARLASARREQGDRRMCMWQAPNENGHDAGAWWKHTAFKGWAGRFQNVDWYGIFTWTSIQVGIPRFHSYQMWLKDATGAVSYMHGWLDFGVGNSTTPQVVVTCGNDSGIRPIMKVNSNTCPANQITFENWYDNNGGAWGIDFGFNINANYRAGGDPANPATWSAIEASRI